MFSIKKTINKYFKKKIECNYSKKCRRHTAPCCNICSRNANSGYNDYYFEIHTKQSNNKITAEKGGE